MQKMSLQSIRIILSLALASSVVACANPSNKANSTVAQAYNSSGVVAVQPYTRSIFSSTNF